MKTKKYYDGIAFLLGDVEVCFWNKIANHIRFYPDNPHKDCLVLSLRDWLFINDTIMAEIADSKY